MAVGYTPIYRIMKDGADITDHFNDRTTLVRVDMMSGAGDGSDRFHITLDDRDFRIQSPIVGEKLAIYMGYKEVGLAYMGTFEINEVTFEGPPRQIRITGTSAGMTDLMKSQAYNSFDNKTVKEILEDVAGKAGVQVQVSPDLADKKIPFKHQTGISAYHLMHEMERHFNAVAKIADGKLLFLPRDKGENVKGVKLDVLVLRPEHFGQWSIKYSERTEYSEVRAAWRDKDKQSDVWETEKAPVGPEGAKPDKPVPFRMNKVFNSKEEAQQAAKAKVAALMRGLGSATVDLAKGDPWINPQQHIIITAMRDGVNGTFVIESVVHSYTKQTGLQTKIQAKTPGDGVDRSDLLKRNQAPIYSPSTGQAPPAQLPSQTAIRPQQATPQAILEAVRSMVQGGQALTVDQLKTALAQAARSVAMNQLQQAELQQGALALMTEELGGEQGRTADQLLQAWIAKQRA